MSGVSEQIAELTRLWNTKEPLDPELARHVIAGPIGPFLNHPLVQCMAVHPVEHAMLNAMLKQKRDAVRQAREDRKWNRYVFLHERPYRMEALLRIATAMKAREFWLLLGGVWTDSENIWQHRRDYLVCFEGRIHSTKYRGLMMNSEERKALAAMPDTLTVYRGGHSGHAFSARAGLSWTLSESKARWFATRLLHDDHEGLLYQRTIRKQDVIAHFTGRNEAEVVMMPSASSPPKLIWRGT